MTPSVYAITVLVGAAAQVASWFLLWRSLNNRLGRQSKEEVEKEAVRKREHEQMWKAFAEDHGIPYNGGSR